MHCRLLYFFLISFSVLKLHAQTPQPLRQFLNSKELKGASFSLLVKDLHTGETICGYDTERELIPASVMKLVTTATALEVLGDDFRFETTIEYDGIIEEGVLKGNLYIKGSGDPTLGSSHFIPEGTTNVFHAQQEFLGEWVREIKKAGITRIEGAIIADDSAFDTEGVPMKWLHEDMGSYYGAGSYGINVFDNLYRLTLTTGEPGTQPEITEIIPAIPSLRFNNRLTTLKIATDSSYITGYSYSNERFLYGAIPANKEKYTLRGDIPDPALFLAGYLNRSLQYENIEITNEPTSYRILQEKNEWQMNNRTQLYTTLSPPLKEIVGIINQKSHNLYTDAVLKVIGQQYESKENEVLSSFDKGTLFVLKYWSDKGLDTSSLWMFDGSGLAPTDKLTTGFICDLLLYMHHSSPMQETYFNSLPKAGEEGSVRNFLKGSTLQGKARLKSGSMSRVKSYAGYIRKEDKEYVMAVIVNNYQGEGRNMTGKLEKLLLSLF